MTNDRPLHILLAVADERRAEDLSNELRSRGLVVRSKFIASARDLDRNVGGDLWDILLCDCAEDPAPARALIQHLGRSGSHARAILLDTTGQTERLTLGMRWGAIDVMLPDQEERLALVLRRELEFARVRRGWQQAETAFAEAEGRNQLLLESSSSAISYVHDGMHIFANAAYLELFGLDNEDDLAGVPLLDMVQESARTELRARVKNFPLGDSTQPFEFLGKKADGEDFTATAELSEAAYEGEESMQVLIRPKGAAAERRAQPAGAASSRVSAIDRIAELCSRGHGAIVYAQLDQVPALRAKVGLTQFDALMTSVTKAMRSSGPRDAETLQFGDATVIMVLNERESDTAMDATEAIRADLEEQLLDAGDNSVQVTCTFGVAMIREGTEPAQLLEQAHEASSGAITDNSVNLFEVSAPTEVIRGPADIGSIEGLIEKHLEDDTFVLMYQPIISLAGDGREHYEVFIRMPDVDGSLLTPDAFFPQALNADLAGKIDRWVVLNAIKKLSEHRNGGHNTFLTINLSAASIIDTTCPPWLSVAIKAAGVPRSNVIFQIADSDASNYLRQAREFTRNLQALECRCGLTRWGASDNPYGTLRHLAISSVKLDGRLILDDDSRMRVPELISELRGQDILTILPMVESAKSLSSLWSAGAHCIQGHYLQEASREMDYDFSTE